MSVYTIKVDAFEAGVLTQIIWNSDKRTALKSVLDQLITHQRNFMDEAGVQIEKLPDG